MYRNDLEILRKAFIEKFEFYLRLVNDSLQDAECQDRKLLGKIASIREQIANVVNSTELNDNDLKWLKKIGFTTIDIWKISIKAKTKEAIKAYRAALTIAENASESAFLRHQLATLEKKL